MEITIAEFNDIMKLEKENEELKKENEEIKKAFNKNLKPNTGERK